MKIKSADLVIADTFDFRLLKTVTPVATSNKYFEQIINKNKLIFFFCWLKLSMMTPMKRLSVKKEPKMMKMTKYRYM